MKQEILAHLSQAIGIATVSHSDPKDTDWTKFDQFIRFLEEAYPLIHQQLKRSIINQYGLVFHWPAANQSGSGADLPVLLTAHYDVVAASEKGWRHAPFSGHDDGAVIWGRGALDDKSSLICIMEAVTKLLKEHYQPRRNIYLAFGFDEEQGGDLGAQKIAAYFAENQISFDYVLDEGGAVVEGSMMGVKPSLAVIGLAEKGNTSFRLTFSGAEGHASTPPQHTAIGTMAAFINQVEDHPCPIHLTETVREMLKTLAPHMGGAAGLALKNPDLFFPIIKKILLKNKQTAAMLRTSVAFTMADAGSGHNVLPKEASCVVNVRILQEDSVASIKKYFADFGYDYKIEPILVNEPTRVSDVHSPAMSYVSSVIESVFENTIALPYLMVGGTDSRYYENVAKNSFRFLPCRLTAEELGTMHATNERISHENVFQMIRFYQSVLENL